MQKKKLGVVLSLVLVAMNLGATVDCTQLINQVAKKGKQGENIIRVDLRNINSLLPEPIIKEVEVVQDAEEAIEEYVEEYEYSETEVASYEVVQAEEIVEVVEEEYVEYIEPIYLEPHFNPYNLLEVSNVTREQMYTILEGTALQTLSNGYVYMEEVYGINALFLVAISAYESGWGRSELAMTHNNLGGLKANDGSWAYFNDWFECLSYKADLLYHQYLSVDGAYYNGTSTWSINARYCEEDYWADNINAIAYELLNKLY